MPEEVHLIDLYDGTVYELPDVQRKGGITELRHIPIWDYPMLVVFGDVGEWL